MNSMNPPSQRTPQQVLVIADFLPTPVNDAGLRLTYILSALRELGHVITLVVRDGKMREHLEAAQQKLGIRVYAGDRELLSALGKDEIASNWSFTTVLSENSFDTAILVQNFRCGISIPEHYLDVIRKHSPQTRILILSDELYGQSTERRAEITQQLEHYELAKDRSAREWEAFHRADFVIARHAADEQLLQRDLVIKAGIVPDHFPVNPHPSNWKERKGILLKVDLTQPAEVHGFAWFLERVWSVLNKSNNFELMIAGADELPQKFHKKLPAVKWFTVEDQEKLASCARIFVAPSQFGRMSGSLVSAVGNGLPGVITNIAARSAALQAGEGVLVADIAEDFAAAISQLYQDHARWSEVSIQGMAFARTNFSWDRFKSSLQDALYKTGGVKPSASRPFSMMEVDARYGARLSQVPQERRLAFRLDAHVQLAQELLNSGKPAEARSQLRHVFGWMGESVEFNAPLARMLGVLTRCYRELNDTVSAARCAKQARRCFASQLSVKPVQKFTAVHIKKDAPQISLIVPTFNRRAILQKCMAALEAQTFPAKDFEVIVIDDGSNDGTEAMMRQYRPPFGFQYLHQENSGTGAARRNGVAHAKGKYLLLMNDDTICDPDLIEQHMRLQQELGDERWAVLGNFEYPAEARHRAFTHFLRTSSFMFPQVDMEAGFPHPYSNFITCNLSILRSAVLEAGSFDSTYKLSEDTELGIRLFEMGYGVLYHPAAHAWHDHLPYAVSNLIRRARVYGTDYFYMFRKHPRVLREWAMPVNLAGMDKAAALAIKNYLEINRRSVEAAAAALERWENVEFEPVLARPEEAKQIVTLFQQAVPAIHWFYLLEKMLETMVQELKLTFGMPQSALAMGAVHSRR